MNLRLSIFITFFELVLNTLGVTSISAQPGPNGVPSIQSCYQLVEFDLGEAPINLLKSNSYVFIPSGNAGAWPDYWEIHQYSGGVELQRESNYFGLHGDGFEQGITPSGILVVDAAKNENNQFVFNQRSFSFDPNADVVTIRPWHWTQNPLTLEPGNNGKEFHLKNAEEVFDFTLGLNQSCNTFDNFFSNITTSLPGFCGFLNPTAEILIHLPAPENWNSVISEFINIGESNTLQHSSTFCDECVTASAPWYLNHPVPCKCIKFDLKVTISPCPNASEECEDLVIVKEVDICCECDVRQSPPNTGN